MENAIILMTVLIIGFMIGFIVGTLRTGKTNCEYIPTEQYIPVPEQIKLSDEEAFLQLTIVFEGNELTQKELMLHLKHIGAKIGKAKNKDSFFVKIPDYPSPIKINYFSYKFFKTIK